MISKNSKTVFLRKLFFITAVKIIKKPLNNVKIDVNITKISIGKFITFWLLIIDRINITKPKIAKGNDETINIILLNNIKLTNFCRDSKFIIKTLYTLYMIKLYFVRHFPTNANAKNLWCGKNTNLSINFAKAKKMEDDGLLNDIKSINFDYIYTSPLKRCLQTCDFLKFDKTKITKDERLIERDFGKIEQTPCIDSIKRDLADFDLNTDLNMNVEKIQDIYKNRLIPFLNDVKELPNKSNVLIVSHSWIGRLLKFYFSNNKKDIYIAPKNGLLLYFSLK